jgi:invasion protein IalB
MGSKTGWYILTLLFIAVGSSATIAAEDFNDWRYTCETPDSSCMIGQGLTYEESGLTYSIQILHPESAGMGVIRLNFPLGIYLPRDVGLAVGKETREVPMLVCLPAGCHAIITIDEELRRSLLAEKDIRLRFYVTSEEPREIKYSLAGFEGAYNRLTRAGTTFYQ